MQENNSLEKLEQKSRMRETRKAREKRMKISGKSVFNIERLIKQDEEKSKSN